MYSVLHPEKLENKVSCQGNTECIMELHWDYDYYQPWTDNEWIVEEIMAIKDKEDKGNAMNNILAHQDQIGLQT